MWFLLICAAFLCGFFIGGTFPPVRPPSIWSMVCTEVPPFHNATSGTKLPQMARLKVQTLELFESWEATKPY